VFFLPAAAHTEKDGNFTNTQRLLQWHHKACEPPADCRSELHWIYHRGRAVRQKLASSKDARDRPILDLTWDYPVHGPHDEPDAEHVLQEISGHKADGSFLDSYDELEHDGSMTCGSWIHCGIYKDGVNQSARKKPRNERNWVSHEWGWAWPKDTRLLYNRASADPEGKPWSERKRDVWWDAEQGQWTSLGDSPHFAPTKPPDLRPAAQSNEAGVQSAREPVSPDRR
jgi:formate dehydrogenase major subunit